MKERIRREEEEKRGREKSSMLSKRGKEKSSMLSFGGKWSCMNT